MPRLRLMKRLLGGNLFKKEIVVMLTKEEKLELVSKFGGNVVSDEIGLPVKEDGLVLPCGASGRWVR